MEEKLKISVYNQKGITLIALIVTIVLLLILSLLIVNESFETYRQTKIIKFIAEMQTLQDKVDIIYQENRDYLVLGQPLTSTTGIQALNNAFQNNEISNQYLDTDKLIYRYFTIEDIAQDLGIDNALGDIVVNFRTREIVSVNGIEYNGITHYTQYNLPGGQKLLAYSGEVIREISNLEVIPAIDGINATITISNVSITNGTLFYKFNNNNNWQTISNYTEENEQYEIIVSVSGTYAFRLVDNNNNNNYTEAKLSLVLTNAPKLENKMTLNNTSYNYSQYEKNSSTWAYSTLNGLIYVWVPRFVYNDSGKIKFARGNSNIATDDTFIDSTWKLPAAFTQDGVELTGVWKQLASVSVDLKLLNLVNENI